MPNNYASFWGEQGTPVLNCSDVPLFSFLLENSTRFKLAAKSRLFQRLDTSLPTQAKCNSVDIRHLNSSIYEALNDSKLL
jgi:hypothetical protein